MLCVIIEAVSARGEAFDSARAGWGGIRARDQRADRGSHVAACNS